MSVRFGRWGHLLLHVVGLVFLLTMIEVIVYARNVRVDLTPDRKFTLSQHAEQILDQLEAEVQIIAFVRSEDARNREMKDLFWRVRERQPKVSWRLIDVNRNPALAREYEADAYGAVVVESRGRRKSFSNVTREDVLMAAILQVTRGDRKVVYFMTGHGEHDIEDSGRRKGYTTARSVLLDEFYEVRPLSLVGSAKIPEDASVVVIPGPKTDLLPEELLELDAYIRRGGGVFALLDPDTSPSLSAFLERYRIRLPNRFVADAANSMAQGEPLTMRIADPSTHALITTRLSGDPVFSLARPIEVLKDDPDSTYASRAILRTGVNAWSMPSAGGRVAGEVEFDASRGDQQGQQIVGVQIVVELDKKVQEERKELEDGSDAPHTTSRIVVLGDSNFADNFFIEILGNKDLFLNSVNWLSEEDQMIAIRPVKKTVGKEQIFLSGRQSYWAFLNFTVLQPLAVLGVGIAVFAWRKLR